MSVSAGEQEPHSILEIVNRLSEQQNQVEICSEDAGDLPHLTMEDLTKLKERELKKHKMASQSHLAVVIMNALTTKEQREGRSILGTKTRPALGSSIVNKIREYYFKVYPCSEDKNEAEIWSQCIICMNNRLKKYDKVNKT